MPAERGRLEQLLRRDRILVAAGLAAVTILAWGYLLYLASKMEGAGGGSTAGVRPDLLMPQGVSWGAVELVLLFVMWAIMMVAMMVPSAAPLVLTFAKARRRREGAPGGRVIGSSGLLLVGYLAVWSGFSVLATLAQWTLHEAALLSPMMVTTSSALGGVLLVAAGIFQLTPLKRACLVHCRSPMSFLMTEWRPGGRGAFIMGLKHGVYCVGCCWMLMALLFVAGVMNLLWVAAIALFVLAEKIAPGGEILARVTGVVLIAAGILLVS